MFLPASWATTCRARSDSRSSSRMCLGPAVRPAMRAKADGYTILMGHIGTQAFSASLYPNLAYKQDVDFEPIGVAVEMPEFIVARKDFPANNLKEFITYVKANAENLNMAHAGVGSIKTCSHAAMTVPSLRPPSRRCWDKDGGNGGHRSPPRPHKA